MQAHSLESQIDALLTAAGRPVNFELIRQLVDGPGEVTGIADQIFAAMNRLAFSPGASVTFYRLRLQPELATIPKAEFDAACLLLEKQRRCLLMIHDHAAALPEAERARFVTDGLGAYYVSIYAR
jgi:hypothetical protein